jgi:hypothetical protein
MKLILILLVVVSIFLPTIFAAPKSALAAPLVSMKDSKLPSSPTTNAGFQIPKGLKLLIGAGGIYAAFLYYGTLQEDVFHYKAADGSKFKQAWFLQSLGNLTSSFKCLFFLLEVLSRSSCKRCCWWSWTACNRWN